MKKSRSIKPGTIIKGKTITNIDDENQRKQELAIKTAGQMKKLLDRANMTLLPVVTIVGGQVKGDVQLVFKE